MLNIINYDLNNYWYHLNSSYVAHYMIRIIIKLNNIFILLDDLIISNINYIFIFFPYILNILETDIWKPQLRIMAQPIEIHIRVPVTNMKINRLINYVVDQVFRAVDIS